MIRKFILYFIPAEYHGDTELLRRSKLLVNTFFLTPMFSFSYLLISLYLNFKVGVYMMVFNVVVFLILPFLFRAGCSSFLCANIYLTAGATAVTIIIFYSGGLDSPVLPWFVVVPIAALLLAGIRCGLVWTIISALLVVALGVLKISDFVFPQAYNVEWRDAFSITTHVGMVALVFFIAMVFENGRLQAQELLKQKNLELDEALKELREKNDQIMSSIHYAKRIQSAVLPADSYLHQANLDLFILFKPRDIVSGDFYWFHDKGDKMFLAVVDCTGHGVPGALMSMIGNSLLNKIVLEQGIEYPAEILERLQVELEKVLISEKTIHASREGMDVCLCIFSPKKSKVFFTGALRPLYKATQDRKTGNWEIIEIKGERNFIGGRSKTNKGFKNHEIKMAPGNMLYLTTDGFADQFDHRNIRYGSGRLKTFLAEIAHLDTRAQKQALLEELAAHQGNGEQIDDITIIGVRAPLIINK